MLSAVTNRMFLSVPPPCTSLLLSNPKNPYKDLVILKNAETLHDIINVLFLPKRDVLLQPQNPKNAVLILL